MFRSITNTLFGIGAATLLTACALPQKSDPAIANAVPQPEPSTFAQWLGNYRSVSEPLLNLDITLVSEAPVADHQSHGWAQWADGNQSNPRRFLMSFSNTEGSLESYFAPTNDGMVSDRRCAVEWQFLVGANNTPTLFGQTTPSECRFSTPNGELGLLKEWSFDGRAIRVADQLFDLSDGQPVDAAQVVEFVRIERFEGWAAVAEAGEWRVDEGLVVLSDGQRRPSQDAAGMSLNVGIMLQRTATAGAQRLQLVVSDQGSGEVLGQAWASADATRIGWANESVQVELMREPR